VLEDLVHVMVRQYGDVRPGIGAHHTRFEFALVVTG
jgi:hypothetical protein